jgi:hypothetical protein
MIVVLRGPVQTIASDVSITAKVSTTVLSETHAGIAAAA